MMDQPQGQGTQSGTHSCAVDRLYDRSRRMRENAHELESTLRDVLTEARSALREQFESHPYTVFGASFATGYVLGGGLPSRFTRFLVTIGTRVAISRMAQQFISDTVSGDGHAAASSSL